MEIPTITAITVGTETIRKGSTHSGIPVFGHLFCFEENVLESEENVGQEEMTYGVEVPATHLKSSGFVKHQPQPSHRLHLSLLL